METKYHIEITRKALADQFSENALTKIIKANIKQDRISYMLGHDYIHVDGSAFEESFEYISTQEKLIYTNMMSSNYVEAREAFGRLLHTWQDFYSHSNYISLWLANHQNCPPEDIIMDDPEIINHPQLQSGKNYGLIEFLSMLPVISNLIIQLMPPDSHARMNLDGPSSSPKFSYAYWAALKRTKKAYEQINQQLMDMRASENIISHFNDK